MNKIITILLALLLVGLLFGCITPQEADTTDNSNIDVDSSTESDNRVSNEIDETIIDEDDDIDVGEMY